MMDDTINKNFWHVPTNAMKKYATSFIKRPWIIHPSGDHPQYLKEGVMHNSATFIDDVLNVQEKYKAGEIIDVTYEQVKEDPSKKAWFATVKVTNKEVLNRIKSGSISPYVSPQIYDLSKALPNEPTTEFIPLHIATVNEPAYGNIARIRATCNGSGPTCINALKSAAEQLTNMVNSGFSQEQIDNSSFLKNLPDNIHRLTNPINFNPQEQVIANNGYNPYEQQQLPPQQQQQQQPQQQYVDQNGQLISQRTQSQQLDANGNVITRTEDRKPSRTTKQPAGQIIATPDTTQVNAPLQQQPQQQSQNPVATQVPVNPDVTINTPLSPQQLQQTQAPALPTEFLEAFKGVQASLQGLTDRLNNVENFKKSTEDEKIKKASEAQRQIIEGVFTPDIIADDTARQQVIDKFVSLPLSDEDLKWILDLVTTGSFSVPEEAAPVESASKKQSAGRPKGAVKQASLNRLSLQQVPETFVPTTGSSIVKKLFGDIDFGNIR